VSITQAHMETFLKQSASDFLTCGLSYESRAREPACRSCHIDLIDERFVEGNVDPYGLTGVGKEWNSEQDGPCFERCFYIFVTQDIITVRAICSCRPALSSACAC
jgi:hypothetical protein